MSEELKNLKKQLLKDERNGYDVLSASELEKMEAYCTVYKAFLDAGKTERLSARAAIALAEKHGFVACKRGMALSAGDKVYTCNRNKGLMLAVIGRRSLAEGAQIAAAHIDSPRLDLKPNPLYEDSELAYFKTHYYGGVRKYQWVTIPLELRGTVVLTDGTVVDVCIGEGNEPKLVITDLLPHLGAEQSKKPLSEAIPGETLNILLGKKFTPCEGGEHAVAEQYMFAHHALGRKALIVTGNIVRKGDAFARLVSLLDSLGIGHTVFADIPSEPNDAMVAAGVAVYQAEGCDHLIGIGGGSPLDTAKAIAIGTVLPGSVCAHAGKEISATLPPFALIPTTAGTGSEATKFTVITDHVGGAKLLLKAIACCPRWLWSIRLSRTPHRHRSPRRPGWTRSPMR